MAKATTKIDNDERLRLARRAQALQDDYADEAKGKVLDEYFEMDPADLAIEVARLEQETSGEATGAAAAQLQAEATKGDEE